MPDVTKRILTDETGQDIVEALNNLIEAVDPTSSAATATAAAEKINNMTVEASSLASNASATVTISEVSGHKHISFGIPRGEAPALSIGTITTVNSNEEASASITGTNSMPVLNLNIPRGVSGNETIDDTDISTSSVWSSKKVSDELDELDTVINSEVSRLDGTKADAENMLSYKTAGPDSVVEVYDAVAEAVKTMQIEIAPVQDLHGYDHPWVGGAGKNKIKYMRSDTIDGIVFTYTQSTGAVSMSGTASRIALEDLTANKSNYQRLPAGNYKAVCVIDNTNIQLDVVVCYDNSTTEEYAVTSSTSIVSFTTTAEAYIVTRFRCANGYAITGSITYYPMLMLATEMDTTFEPYSNICPISGFTEANVVVNLLDYRKIFSEGETLKANALSYKMTVPNGIYTLSTNIPLDGTLKSCFFTNKGESAQSAVNGVYDGHPRTITVTDGEVGIHVRTNNPSGGYIITEDLLQNGTYWICLREGTTAPIYTITFPDGQTVYGGTLTVNADGTGTLVVDRGYSAITATESGVLFDANNRLYIPSTFFPGVKGVDTNDSIANAKTNMMQIVSVNGTYTHTGIGFAFGKTGNGFAYSPSMNSKEEWQAYLASTNLQVVYELAASTLIPLTAPQIRTILGYNRIYASTGSILSMLYPAEKYQTAEQADKERIHAVVDEPSAVVSITDGADNVPMGMQIAIEPVQDKHGLEPYPPGGGKNIIPLTLADLTRINTSGTWNDNTYTYRGIAFTVNVDDGGNVLSITANGTASSNSSFRFGELSDFENIEYTLNGCPSGGNYSNGYFLYLYNVSTQGTVLRDEGTGDSGILTSETTYGISIMVRNGAAASNKVFYPMLRLSSVTDATYAPYSNICPITGWTQAEVVNNGDNLVTPKSPVETFDLNGTGTYRYGQSFAGGKKYTVVNNTSYQLSYRVPKADLSNRGTTAYFSANSYTEVDVPSDSLLWIFETSVSNWTINRANISVNTVSDTTISTPTIYTITFPTSAGTVYGGTLTVNKDGTGGLVVDRGFYTIPQITQDMLTTSTTAGSTGVFVKVPTTGTISGATDNNAYYAKCSVADARTNATRGGAWTVNAGGEGYTNIWVPSDSALADLNEKLQGQQIVNTLKTVITYTLSAPVIRSLLGTNNVWADTGNIIKLEYTADSKLYIDNTSPNISPMTGATSSQNGTSGLVPAPTTTDINKFLRGDGTWTSADTWGGITYSPYLYINTENYFIPARSEVNGTEVKSIWVSSTPGEHKVAKYDVNSFLYSTTPTSTDNSTKVATTAFVKSVLPGIMTGASDSVAGTSGLVPAPAAGDKDKFLSGDGTYKSGGLPMVILSYGNSTWSEFINAYRNNVIVYCRASSNANPASGKQTRMAFMAYVNDADNPTQVEFQYYRSMNPTNKSITQMSDQVFVYTLSSNGSWSVIAREASIKSVVCDASTGLSATYDKNTGTLTLTAAT